MKKKNVVTNNTPSPALPGILSLQGRGKQVVSFAPLREKVGEARMRGHLHGFTLIELLVVVLIIGILAAVAVPQYTKAVRKARIAEAKVLLKAAVDATDMFFLENGPDENPTLDNIDIDISTETKNWDISIDDCAQDSNGKIGCCIMAEPKWESGYWIEYCSPNYNGGPEIDDTAGKFTCTNNAEICKGLGTQLTGNYSNFYEL